MRFRAGPDPPKPCLGRGKKKCLVSRHAQRSRAQHTPSRLFRALRFSTQASPCAFAHPPSPSAEDLFAVLKNIGRYTPRSPHPLATNGIPSVHWIKINHSDMGARRLVFIKQGVPLPPPRSVRDTRLDCIWRIMSSSGAPQGRAPLG